MEPMHLYRGGEWLAGPLDAAESVLERTRGLLGRDGLPGRTGMVLDRCSLIHTAFMRFPIDVLFLARDGRVLKVVRDLKPFRMSGALFARCTVELPSGLAAEARIEPGQILRFAKESPPPTGE